MDIATLPADSLPTTKVSGRVLSAGGAARAALAAAKNALNVKFILIGTKRRADPLDEPTVQGQLATLPV